MTKQNTYHVNEISVSYMPIFLMEEQQRIVTSLDAYIALKPFYNDDTISLQEEFIMLYLNRHHKIIGAYPMSKGGISGTIADIRLILSVALKSAASSIVLSHNHPSGNLKPSSQDEDLTKKIIQAAKFMDIGVLDHIILSGEGGYFSFADAGLL